MVALGGLNVQEKMIEMQCIFHRPLERDALERDALELERSEKNWGFHQVGTQLYILYAALPCTKVYTFDKHSSSHALLHSSQCYVDEDNSILTATLLNIGHGCHLSSHAVSWGAHQMIVMVHHRESPLVGGYNHWLLRLDTRDYKITHISHGVVFGAALHHAGGRLPNTFVIGSIAITRHESRSMLHIFGGEGDTFAVYARVDLEAVVWLAMPVESEM